MTDSAAVNHHADHAGFAGVTSLVAARHARHGAGYARLAVDLGAVSEADRVVDIGCGPAMPSEPLLGGEPCTALVR